jgi:hypothetical protein
MEIDRDYALFEEWNQAAEAELGVRIRGPLLSAPGRTHYRILDLGAGQVQAPNWQLSRLGYFKPPLPDYPLGLDVLTGPSDLVLAKDLRCTIKKRGRRVGWMSPRGMRCENVHEIVTEDWGSIVAPGLRWETVWAQYWFNRHHFLQPRPVAYGFDAPWSGHIVDPAIPPDTSPYRELYIADPKSRPNFGLTDDLAGRLLALAARIKGDRTDDGLRYLNITWLKHRRMYNGWVLSRPSACKKLTAWQ